MKIKYFQPLADIENHYKDILVNFDNPKWGHGLLGSWGINLDEKDLIKEEKEVLRYLIGCQLGIVHDYNASKPSLEIVQRCFSRHLSFLDKIYNCNESNIVKGSNLVRKQYDACNHYLFKFSLNSWYEKLPSEILSFENKYTD